MKASIYNDLCLCTLYLLEFVYRSQSRTSYFHLKLGLSTLSTKQITDVTMSVKELEGTFSPATLLGLHTLPYSVHIRMVRKGFNGANLSSIAFLTGQ